MLVHAVVSDLLAQSHQQSVPLLLQTAQQILHLSLLLLLRDVVSLELMQDLVCSTKNNVPRLQDTGGGRGMRKDSRL